MDYFSLENPIRMDARRLVYIRRVIGEGQPAFAKRFGVSQSAIRRIETSGEPVTGPLAICIQVFADQMGIQIPDDEVLDRIYGAKDGASDHSEEEEAEA